MIGIAGDRCPQKLLITDPCEKDLKILNHKRLPKRRQRCELKNQPGPTPKSTTHPVRARSPPRQPGRARSPRHGPHGLPSEGVGAVVGPFLVPVSRCRGPADLACSIVPCACPQRRPDQVPELWVALCQNAPTEKPSPVARNPDALRSSSVVTCIHPWLGV